MFKRRQIAAALSYARLHEKIMTLAFSKNYHVSKPSTQIGNCATTFNPRTEFATVEK